MAEFCQLCAKSLIEDPDIDTIKRELMDAFRIYDKDGQGFITMDTLRALIAELLSPLTDKELDGIIAELDEDGSGTMDFDEFCEMTGELKYVHSSSEILFYNLSRINNMLHIQCIVTFTDKYTL